MRYRMAVWLAVLCAGFAVAASGQEEAGENAPQILSADLAPKQVVEEAELTVNFVVVDNDKVVKVTIDGKPETITPADTVLIEKKFRFKKGRTLVRVEAEDEKGNKRVREFLVAFGVPLEAEKAEEKPPEFTIKVLAEVRLETDENPTSDFGIPSFLESSVPEDVRNVQGEVDDSEQADDRQTLRAIVAMSLGKINWFAGFIDTSYGKALNAPIEWQALLLGGQYRFAEPGEDSFLIGVTLMDLDVGGADRALLQIISPGWQTSEKGEDGTRRNLYGADVTIKDFAAGNLKDGNQFTLKWARSFRDTEKLDSFKGTLAYGTSTEGEAVSDFTFLGYDADWANEWEAGFKFDIGFGVQYRDYSNDTDVLDPDLLGTTRVDIPLRYSTAVGWQFTPDWSVVYRYESTVNLSNKKLYERIIHGLVVKGAF